MKKSTRFWSIFNVLMLICGLATTAAEQPSTRTSFAPDNRIVKSGLSRLPIVERSLSTMKIQSTASYVVIDSLFNAYSFYGSEQQPVCYDPTTGLFVVIKRGALPPTATNAGSPNNSNCLRLLVSKDLGKTWGKQFSLYSGDATKGGLPRYPSVDIAAAEGNTNPDDAVFTFFSPLTKSTSGTITKQRAWDGTTFGYQANDLTSGSAFTDMNAEYDINGTKFWWGTDCTTATFRNSSDDKLISAFSVDLSPSDSATTSPADVNTVALWRKDFYQTSDKPQMTVPAQWASNKFLAVQFASHITRTHVGMHRDNAGNFYSAAYGFFNAAEDSTHSSFGVSKSADHGTTWTEFNIMPRSVFTAFAQSIGCDPDSVFFDWTRSSSNASAAIRLTNYSLAVYGTDSYSCFTQLYATSTQPVGSQLVECYYNNGQWGMRKVAFVSLFENADLWRQFDNDGTLGPTQTGSELQAAVSADGKTILVKYLEAKDLYFKDESGNRDSLVTTDVVLCTRDITSNTWSKVKNVTQSDIADRTTWIPTTVPSDLKNIPLITIQTADKGSTPRENIFDSQMRLATSTEANYDLYKQYVTVTQFNVADLPDFSASGPVDVKDNETIAGGMLLSPNPATEQLTVGFEAVDGEMQLNVTNTLGQTVLSENFEATGSGTHFRTIDASQLSNGSYVVSLHSKSAVTTKTLSVVR